MKADKKDNLLLERLGTVPSYMTLSIEDMTSIVESFANVFKSIWSSLKLLTSTLTLNLKVISASLRRNKEDTKAAYASFETERGKIRDEMDDNLKYFKKFYQDDGVDSLGGFGPKVLVFAASPLLFFTLKSTDKYSEADKKKKAAKELADLKNPKEKDPKGATQRVKIALDFFEFGKENISENVVLPQASISPNVSKQAVEEAKKLSEIASLYVENERKNADKILKNLSGRLAAIKKIIDAKDPESLVSAIDEANRLGMKVSNAGMKQAYDKILKELQSQSTNDPETFKKAVDEMRKKSPELKSLNDLDAANKFVFGLTKSNFQVSLMKSYDDLLLAAKQSMQLPIDDETKENLSKTDIGKKYLSVINNFEISLETGKKEAETIKKSFKDVT